MAAERYDVATLEQALGRLGPALEILGGFTYRNKNQHRLSKWWAQLDMLRRGSRKLALDLQSSIRDRPPPGKRRKTQPGASMGDEKLRLRSSHLRQQVLPRSYFAFTQLAADNQFAQLGVALLGVLAQVDQAASYLTLAETVDAADSAFGETAHAAKRSETKATSEVGADTGVAVSRDHVARALHAERPSNVDRALVEGVPSSWREGVPLSDGKPRNVARDKENGPSKSGKKEKGDEFDELFGSLQPKKSSKKRKKKKDEFDDLFSSLI